jgi:glycosyltransferase involved in cell wall biosynthesis
LKILHIISGLKSGGAEGVLYRLICQDNKNDHHVISLTNQGFYTDLLIKKKISVKCLNMKKNFQFIFHFFKLIYLIKKINPNIIQCWMYHADILGGFAGKILGIKKIYWNLRNSDLNLQWSNKTTIFLAKLSSYLSHILPYRIISCSSKSSTTHIELGYCKKKILLISNGFNEKKFFFSKKLKKKWKCKLKITNNDIIFGFVGRWSSQKDFETLFKAFSCFLKTVKNSKDVKLLLIGERINKNNYELTEKIKKNKLNMNIILVDETIHINQLLNVIDIGVFSSKGNEGFPNVIAEKMLTKIPCVVADVGDAKQIVGNSGWIYKKRNWIDLNKKLKIVYNNFFVNQEAWIVKKNFSRVRINNNFSLHKMVEMYNKAWQI